ncbi:von Willebrand factor type A domain-containing protein [Flavobacterium endophyticum]|uniref:von Willebrand factor type A domain-containing protein n=1 Tax=Flavobacterium endophyticum TaxID=1540163 RepID=A0A495MMD8_9FLAO|nr:VWA domain-containing protein [Flavobacterium endophyticum]RKS26555.1 von Willebrand factor type A domain-containing protein [Flavobacterium endophyticum]
MKTKILFASLLLATSFCFGSCDFFKKNPKEQDPETGTEPGPELAMVAPEDDGNTKIQVALLLDTSNSMDGLIDQAKSRLWNIVNTLTTLKYEGKNPKIEIALYEYGNDGLSSSSNYIRQVTPLSTDLDLISEKLFSLRTNGGSEYCGAVIQDATKQLEWGKGKVNMKLLYIAGNEPFNQGDISYKEAISDALKNDIYVNTIFCGGSMEGINTMWKDGAERGQGKYFNIDSDEKVRYIVTPYDDRIYKCNERLNSTYVGYGKQGYEKKEMQAMQDKNAESVSSSNYAERAVSKSKAVYKNDSWDLVDRVKEDKTALQKIKKEELPKELQNKSAAELKTIVDQKTKERETIQKEMAQLAKQRQDYIDTENKKGKKQDDLGNAIASSILDFAKIKGYTAEK